MPSIWSHALLVVDLVSMKVFVRALGKLFAWATTKADRFANIAEAYYQAAPDDDEPPKAAAMAMPVPRPPVNTNAVSTTRVTTPPVERPSGLVPSPAR
jgi:hypothetical protein